MAGLEVVVRPVVFPDIRPAPARSLPPADDPEKGFAVIRGNGAKHIDLSNSYSASATSPAQREIKRRVDVARVYQKTGDGKVNKENFVDIEVANKLWLEGGSEPTSSTPKAEGTLPAGELTPNNRPRVEVQYYRTIQEAANIEVLKRNQMRTNESEP
jgi:hypothetical protein